MAKQYTERQVIKISKNQAESLAILKTYNVNVSQFIRAAIKEKLQKDWKTIKENKPKEYCPF
jgi:post-segregation antitoxin (ccd killing protein)